LDIKLGSSKQGNLLIARMSNPIADSKKSPQHDRKDRQKKGKKQHNALAKKQLFLRSCCARHQTTGMVPELIGILYVFEKSKKYDLKGLEVIIS
jgi:hypothetical protein